MAIKNISPKFNLKTSVTELALEYGQSVMGDRVGGLSMFANAFKRGYGDDVFGSDANGIWLGAADYADAPFKVDMEGNATITSLDAGGVFLTKDGENQELAGQIIAGGAVNGSFIAKDSEGNIKVVIDKDGVLVNGGKIVVKNDSDISIIDSAGIISDTDQNFQNAQVTGNTEISTSESAYQDVPGASLTLTLSRATRCLITLFVYGINDDFNDGANASEAQIYDTFTGATTGINVWFTGEWFYDVDTVVDRVSAQTESNMAIITLAAGTHILKIRYRAAGGVARIYNWRLSYIAFGN